jgi:hypothetical protein
MWWPSGESSVTTVSGVTYTLVIISLSVAGWVSLGRKSQRGNGILMLILAVTGAATSLQNAGWGPWAFIGTMVYPLVGILLGWLLLRWPRSRLQTRAQTWAVRVAFVLVPLLTAAWCLAWDPRWGGYTGRA